MSVLLFSPDIVCDPISIINILGGRISHSQWRETVLQECSHFYETLISYICALGRIHELARK